MPFYFRLGKRSQQYNVANKDLFVIPIELLTNECIECTLFATSIGQECLNNVCQKIGLQQSEYFGLLFKSRKNVDQWVDLNKPLKKQLDKFAVEVRLYFRLQYFVPNFHFLSDEISRYHYFCAMKGLVIEGRIACSRDDAILLASFSLQAEFGDYSPERHTVEYLNNFALFPKSMVTNKPAHDLLVECAINAYRNLQGVPTNVAEIYYISEAQQREGYGQEGFPARDLDTGQDVCLGVCIRGIFVMNAISNTLELFKWNDIANLVHNKKIFTIERSPDNYRKSYSTFDGDYAAAIWRTCVEQHQYFMKGIHAVQQQQSEHPEVDQSTVNTLSGLPFMQTDELFSGYEHFLARKNGGGFNPMDTLADYSQIRSASLYETIDQTPLSPSPQEYSVNSYLDKKIEQAIIKKRSSTEPIELHHIALSCGNGNHAKAKTKSGEMGNDTSGLTYTQKKLQSKATSNGGSPLAKSSSNTPIYENQLNSSDLTFEQRKKLLPPYKNPPDYEAFIKRKHSAMATLSQSMSSIPSRLASQQQINSSSSSSSLAHPYPGCIIGGATNGTRNIHPPPSSSTMSVPFLLQQQQQQYRQQMLSSVYKNYTDLSNLDLEKRSAGFSGRGSLPPPELSELTASHRPSHPIVLNQLQHQKQQMQSSGMFTASSPELNNLNLFQKRHFHQPAAPRTETAKLNGTSTAYGPLEGTNLKGRMHFPHCFTSVPDLTFRSTSSQQGSSVNANIEMHSDHKKNMGLLHTGGKTKSSLFSFTGKNLRIFRSQHTTGSVPNLSNGFSENYETGGRTKAITSNQHQQRSHFSNSNCYNLPRSRLSSEHLNSIPQQRSNSITMLEHGGQTRQMFNYSSISNKIDEAPELATDGVALHNKVAGLQSNMYSPAHQHLHLQQQQQQHVIYANLNQNAQSAIGASVPHYSASAVVPSEAANQPASSTPNHHFYSFKEPNISSLPNGNAVPGHLQTSGESTHHLQSSAAKTSDSSHTSKASGNSFSSSTMKSNSRIIVFGKSFEDQDFTREFELLPRMCPTAKFTTASLPENVLKNRFRDILPYEENRVKLTPTKDNKTGYINASKVVMTFGRMKQHYIAAQGPLPITTLDFWQMIYEQSISIICMVTNFTESGVCKCYSYLPLSSEPGKNTIKFGDYEVACNYTSATPTFITSFLTLTYGGQKRNVVHLRYTDWNDHSIPDLQSFLSFLSEMDAIYRRSIREGSSLGKKRTTKTAQASSPILVHCSAGAGRSGVVILCDALLKCLDHNFSEPIDIPKALIQLRYQRMISVQHCEQFRFVCQVLSQYLSNSRLI